jgi:hypothetical protein
MSSPFAFIPRKVAKNVQIGTNPGGAQMHDTARGSTVKDTLPRAPVTGPQKDCANVKGKATLKENVGGPSNSGDNNPYADEDYAIAISMALSDYALWCDPDLRRKRDAMKKGDESMGDELCMSNYCFLFI